MIKCFNHSFIPVVGVLALAVVGVLAVAVAVDSSRSLATLDLCQSRQKKAEQVMHICNYML